MGKYIDSEKMIANLRRQKHELELSIQSQGDYGQSCQIVAYENILSLITFLQQEQPEIDWEKELRNWMVKMDGKYALLTTDYVDQLITDTAKHFYGLRNFALEEAARYVYKSWMGGTMDDVRRDMVELGKVLNARKKE